MTDHPRTQAIMDEINSLGYSAANEKATDLCWRLETERDALATVLANAQLSIEQLQINVKGWREDSDSQSKRVRELEAELAGYKQQLALAPTYEKMIAHNGAQEARIRELEAALRTICDPEKCAWTAAAMLRIAENALRGPRGEAGHTRVTSANEQGGAIESKDSAIESPAPICQTEGCTHFVESSENYCTDCLDAQRVKS